MPTIDNLPQDTPNAGTDLFVMWDSTTGRAKKVSLTDMLTVFAAATIPVYTSMPNPVPTGFFIVDSGA